MPTRSERLDRQRFPSAAAYLDRVPGGLAAYPECQVKAALLQSVTDDYSLIKVAEKLPETLAELVRHPPPGVHWTAARPAPKVA